MSKIDSMWFFQKISLGLSLVNGIMLALADNKITVSELVNMVNLVMAGIAPDLKIGLDDITIIENPDGSVAITLSAELVSKLAITV